MEGIRKKRIATLIVLSILICGGCGTGHSEEGGGSEADSKGIVKAVLLGEASFYCCSDGNVEAVAVTEVPALFDAEDPYMKIWEFAVVDLNGDGEEEVILSAFGAAGDMGGKVILHRIDDKVYGYITDSRTLVDLKTDGTYSYSDSTGVNEAGIATVTNFSETGYTADKITYATGTYEGWNGFTVDHQTATEEAWLDAVSLQEQKQNTEWHEFNRENINTMF